MRVNILIFFVFVVGSQVLGQNKSIDSLKNLYSSTESPSERIALKCKISQGYTEIGDFKKAGKVADEALLEAEQLEDKKGKGLAFYTLARLNQYMRDWDKALIYHYQAIQLFDEIKADEELAWSYLNMGIAFHAQSDYKRAIRYDNKALDIFSKIEHRKGVAYSYLNLGLALNDNGSRDTAFAKLADAKRICIEIGDQRGVGYVHNIKGDILLKSGDLEEALIEAEDCIVIREKENDKLDLAFLYGNKSNIYFQQGKLKKAEEALVVAENMGLEIKADLALKKLYLTWSKLDSLNGDYKAAHDHFKKYSSYATVIIEQERERSEAALEYAFKKEQAEKEEELRNEIEEVMSSYGADVADGSNKQLALLATGSVIILLLLVVLFKKKK